MTTWMDKGIRDEVDMAQFAMAQVVPMLDPRDARVAELEAQVAKFRIFPQQVIDAIEQFDWDDDRWWISDVRAIIEGKAGYPADDDSLWLTGSEWQSLLGRAVDGECAQRDARIAELENSLAHIEYLCRISIVPQKALAAILEHAAAALMPSPEGDMTITIEELDA